jgi:hypothetical protein
MDQFTATADLIHLPDLELSATPAGAPESPTESTRLSSLERMNMQELRAEYRRLHRIAPPRLSRDLMIRAVAYRIQEAEQGGLSSATKRKLLSLSKALETNGRVAQDPGRRLKAGARLVREWHGRTHVVTVTDQGFLYEKQNYPSLTRIAREITGAAWSGPRFFGLTRKTATREASDA